MILALVMYKKIEIHYFDKVIYRSCFYTTQERLHRAINKLYCVTF